MPLRIALAQINCTVGDLEGNTAKICENIAAAREQGAAVVIFPELAITGYPPEDLLLKTQFVEDNRRCLDKVAEASRGILAVVGFVDAAKAGEGEAAGAQIEDKVSVRPPTHLYNAAALCGGGRIIDVYRKMFLPNYGVFDEKRYFEPGKECAVYRLHVGDKTMNVGINVCEDIWYSEGPTLVQARHGGADLILNCNSSPYHREKWRDRQQMLSRRAKDNGVYIAYVNLVGGQDELVFDGHSLLFGPDGRLLAQAAQFEESLLVVDVPSGGTGEVTADMTPSEEREDAEDLDLIFEGEATTCRIVDLRDEDLPDPEAPESGVATVISGGVSDPSPPVEEVYRALVLGLGDYVHKNGFHKVILGLSGGIDSALVAAIAADALGTANVFGVNMPSIYSSAEGIEDAFASADRLGIECVTIPIEETRNVLLSELSGIFAGTEPGVAEENLQARLRGNILMSLSNKFGWMVVTTGNKSEMACGYATLYGDMAGGFAVLKDVPKTLVFQLAKWRNRGGEVIPQRVIDKPPSAELRPDQKDEDSLPPYDLLDPILRAYVEEDRSHSEIVSSGFDPEIVARVISLVDRNEYKRRQAAPGVKITPKAFGRDRRMPITNRYRST